MKSVLITGGNGLLGSKLIRSVVPGFSVLSTDIQPESSLGDGVSYEQCDITSSKAVSRLFAGCQPEAVINAAAFTNVDGCESQREEAWAVNVEGAANIAKACSQNNGRLIHISTDYIFDGANGPYREDDVPGPISYYGLTKWEGEKRVQSIVPDAVIARTMVLYGWEPHIRLNFVTWLIAKMKAGVPVEIVTDQYGNPTLADDLARVLWVLLAKKCTGVFHTAGRDWLNRYQFSLQIAEIFGLEPSLISPTTSDRFVQAATRPLKSGLLCERLKDELGIEMPQAAESLTLLKEQLES